MKENKHERVTTHEAPIDLNHVATVVATTAVVGGVATMYATSDYSANNSGVSREFNLGGISNGESVHVTGVDILPALKRRGFPRH